MTPVRLTNREGLSAISYRVGTQPLFRRSMLAALSSSQHKALAGLGTRDDDDASIALIDAWASVADVLTFYQERFANEAYFPTATERLSLLELARLIGYELRPGVAASTYIAFTMETASGAPRRTNVDAGTKIQSIPGPNEKPQIFETSTAIEARVEWNALTPRLSLPQVMTRGLQELFFEGVETQLQPGDAILIVGSEREEFLISERWDFRFLDTVVADADAALTRVTWLQPLGHEHPGVDPALRGVQVFAMRQRAALFGHNAPDPRLLRIRAGSSLLTRSGDQWANYTLNSERIDLDIVYPKITVGSWVVFDSPPYRELARVSRVTTTSASRFAMSGKFTQFVPDAFEHSSFFDLRTTAVFAQSEALPLAERPVRDPVYGNEIALGQLAPDLLPGQALAVAGKRLRLQLTRRARNLHLTSDSGATADLVPGDSLQVMQAPVVPAAGSTTTPISPAALVAAFAGTTPSTINWQLRNSNGFQGSLNVTTDLVALAKAEKDDEEISEITFISTDVDAVQPDNSRTTIKLNADLLNCYDRKSVHINANVAPATHGETVQEVLGAGDASQSYQRFTLKQTPLTYISASTPSGAKPTLEVRVNEILWREAPTLYGRGARDRVYVNRTFDDGRTTISFGDGATGARLPTGQNNVQGKYRKGIGLKGLVAAGQLSQLMTRPLGIKEATNPQPATGAEDRESLADARQNAPLTVLTLDRAVSLRDYEDFARAFGGIAKALTTYSWDGRSRRILITIAGPQGAEIKQDSDTFRNLVAALTNSGDPFVSLSVLPHHDATFRLVAKVKVDEPTFLRRDVIAAVDVALRDHFSFEARAFGQSVVLSDVVSVMQGVEGVIAVDVDQLYRAEAPPSLGKRLTASLPSIGPDGKPLAAELLTLDAAPLDLGVML